MTFLTELARLREAAIKDHMQQNKLAAYLYKHSEAIEGLVRAADGHGCGWKIDDPRSNGPCAICNALEKLNRSE